MISVAIIVKDGEDYLEECLKSLEKFEEVLLMDTGSKDKTLEIARKFSNVKIVEHDFIGFGPTKNLATEMTTNDWILSIDSDEVLSSELSWSILNQNLKENVVYRFIRQSYYNKKFIRGCGWYPDKILRLYNKKRTGFNENMVHESIVVTPDMRIEDLKGVLRHYPFDNAASLIDKFQFYSTLYADQNKGKLSSSPFKAISRGLVAFIKGYIIRRGFLDGNEGFLICFCQGLGTYFKYIKLYEANK